MKAVSGFVARHERKLILLLCADCRTSRLYILCGVSVF